MFDLLILLALIPPVFLVWWVCKQDTNFPIPIGQIVPLSALGCAVAIPAVIVELYGSFFIFSFSEESLPYILIENFLIVAVAEEGCKFAFLMTQWSSKHFRSTYDGIVFAVGVSLGFAMLENVIYALSYGLATVMLRAFTSIPLHMCCGVLMGIFFGKAKLASVRKQGSVVGLLLVSFFVPWSIHGLYDALLSGGPIGSLMAIGIAISLFICIMFLVKHFSEQDVVFFPNQNVMQPLIPNCFPQQHVAQSGNIYGVQSPVSPNTSCAYPQHPVMIPQPQQPIMQPPTIAAQPYYQYPPMQYPQQPTNANLPQQQPYQAYQQPYQNNVQ